jgi:hypothetical protein
VTEKRWNRRWICQGRREKKERKKLAPLMALIGADKRNTPQPPSRQRSEDRRQKKEDRRQRSEVRGQKTEKSRKEHPPTPLKGGRGGRSAVACIL